MINLLFDNGHWILVLVIAAGIAAFMIATKIESRLESVPDWDDDEELGEWIDDDDDDEDWLPESDESIVLVPTAVYTPLSESRLAYEAGDLTEYTSEHVAKLLSMEADVRHFMTRQDLDTAMFIHEMAA